MSTTEYQSIEGAQKNAPVDISKIEPSALLNCLLGLLGDLQKDAYSDESGQSFRLNPISSRSEATLRCPQFSVTALSF